MFIFDNSNHRTPLNNEIVTMKFKVLYPDFTTWNNELKEVLKPEEIPEQVFKRLDMLIGNKFLRYTTDDKNHEFLRVKYFELYKQYQRKEELYNKKFEDLLKQVNSQETTLYTVNRTAMDAVENDFIDNRVKTVVETQLPQITHMNEWLILQDLPNPFTEFVKALAKALVLPVQPNGNGNIFSDYKIK